MSGKTGLKSLGFINNLDSYLDEIKNLTKGTSQEIDFKKINTEIENQKENGKIRFLNKFGYDNDREKGKLNFNNAQYIVFETSYNNLDGNKVIGWFYRNRIDQNYTGVHIGIEDDLQKDIQEGCFSPVYAMSWG